MWEVSAMVPIVHWGRGHVPMLLVNYREYLDIWADKIFLCVSEKYPWCRLGSFVSPGQPSAV